MNSRSMTTAIALNLEDASVTHSAAGYAYKLRRSAGKMTHTESINVNGTEQVALTAVFRTRQDSAAVRYHENMARQLMPKGQ